MHEETTGWSTLRSTRTRTLPRPDERHAGVLDSDGNPRTHRTQRETARSSWTQNIGLKMEGKRTTTRVRRKPAVPTIGVSVTLQRGPQAPRIMGREGERHASLQRAISACSSRQWCETQRQSISTKILPGNKWPGDHYHARGVLDNVSGKHFPSGRIGHSAALWLVCEDIGNCILCFFSATHTLFVLQFFDWLQVERRSLKTQPSCCLASSVNRSAPPLLVR